LDELATMMETFFGVYEQRTEHYRSVRNGETSPEEKSELYFLSYAHRNRIMVDQIEIHLLRQHRRVWRDETDLRAGRKLLSNLYHEIEDAHVFACVLTGAYVQSRYCMTELERAVHRELETGRPRVVILKADRKCEIPRIATDHVWIDVDTEAKLALAIARLLGQQM
jgi:TIR domain